MAFREQPGGLPSSDPRQSRGEGGRTPWVLRGSAELDQLNVPQLPRLKHLIALAAWAARLSSPPWPPAARMFSFTSPDTFRQNRLSDKAFTSFQLTWTK